MNGSFPVVLYHWEALLTKIAVGENMSFATEYQETFLILLVVFQQIWKWMFE